MATNESLVNGALFEQGIGEAEKLRRSLLTPVKGITPVRALAQTAMAFRDRYVLYGFKFTEHDWVSKLSGERGAIDGRGVFGPFVGKWYGKWQGEPVDHDWGDVKAHEPMRELGSLRLAWSQYAWVGDGFGWNVIAEPADTQGGVILGVVYHVTDGDVARIKMVRPHVGIEDGNGRIIWITGGEVFLEMYIGATAERGERYSITGFHYDFTAGRVQVGEGFATEYTRDPENRQLWRRIVVAFGN